MRPTLDRRSKTLVTAAGALAALVIIGFILLQSPAVKDALRCWITTAFFLDYKPRTAPEGSVTIVATAQTAPVANRCDAADDPAIWVNSEDPSKSLILGTNKLGAINVYNLRGEALHRKALDAPNNVDLREVTVNGARKIIVGASDKQRGEILLFELDPGSGALSEVLSEPIVAMTERETYGFCMYYRAETNELYAIATDKSGQIEQWRLRPSLDGTFSGEFERTLRLDSQAEGCVVDDENGRLFVAEEDYGIWAFGADPRDESAPQMVARAGAEVGGGIRIRSDVEGLAVYAPANSDSRGFLIVSSQGNDSYVVFDRVPPFAYRGVFQIEFNEVKTGDTDGLEITALNTGVGYERGLLVVQDGAPAWLNNGNQNFKLVPWDSVMVGLDLSAE